MRTLVVLLLTWVSFTLPSTVPDPDACEGGHERELGLGRLELHGAPQWSGYVQGPRTWPGVTDTVLATYDVRGREGTLDSVGVDVPWCGVLWGVLVDVSGNRSCIGNFHLVRPDLATPAPASWPFRKP